jgi:hypothetical protein
VAARFDEARGEATVELEYHGTATPPDRKNDRNVSKERAPVVCRIDNGDVERLILQNATDGKDITRPLIELLED